MLYAYVVKFVKRESQTNMPWNQDILEATNELSSYQSDRMLNVDHRMKIKKARGAGQNLEEEHINQDGWPLERAQIA